MGVGPSHTPLSPSFLLPTAPARMTTRLFYIFSRIPADHASLLPGRLACLGTNAPVFSIKRKFPTRGGGGGGGGHVRALVREGDTHTRSHLLSSLSLSPLQAPASSIALALPAAGPVPCERERGA